MMLASLFHRLTAFARRIRRIHATIAAGLIGAYLLFAWLALPGILQSQAERYVLKQSGHHLTMDRPSFNPFLLRLRIRNLRLTEPDGKPLLAFKDLLVDISATSLFRRAYVFDEIRLDGLDASVVVLRQNRLNWSALIEAFQSKEKKSSELPRLLIRKFSLSQSQLFLADRRTAVERATRLTPINFELTELSTLPDEKGHHHLTAKTSFGARITWSGVITLKPILVAGQIHIDSLALPRLAAYVTLPPRLAVPQGVASLSARYQAGMMNDAFNLKLDRLAFRLDGFRIEGRNDPEASLAFGRIAVTGGRFDLLGRRISINTIALSGGGISAVRDRKGKINLLSLLPASDDKQTAKAGPAWRYRIGQVKLDGFGVDVRDAGPGARFGLTDIAVDIKDVSEDMTRPLPVQAAFRSRDGGSFTAEGTIVPATPSADMQIKLDGLVLTPAQPYLGQLTTLKLVDGALSAEGHATFDGKTGEYTGGAAVRNLRIVEADGKTVLLGWKSLTTTTVSASPSRLAVREILLDGLETRLIIAKDKSINFTKIFRQPLAQTAPQAKPAALFPVQIGRLRISRSQMDYADLSLALPFGTHIHALTGTLVHISTTPGAPARLQIQGQIDDYGMAQAAGRLNLFRPTDLMDVKVDFTNVEMARLTPYSATFAGRQIDSGKLTLHLQYKIQNRQLLGDNQIIMDQITLGKRVESPQARDLPLDLAIAILEDSNGRIDLGLPVSGSLDDPKFSYRQIIWKAIVNVLTKIVTAPFRALGALFGGDEDQFDGIVFTAGSPTLTPPEREKTVAFAAALTKHPKLSVTIHGTWSDADRIALQDLQLRKAIAGKLGLSTEGDPGLLSPDQPKVKRALESLYADRFGNGGLAALKEGFGKANPGKLETTTSGRFMSVFTGLIGSKPDLSDSDVARLKGADLHTVLYQRLQTAEVVSDAALQQLAQARGQSVMSELQRAQAPADRVKLDAAEKIDANEKDVPVKFDMGAITAN